MEVEPGGQKEEEVEEEEEEEEEEESDDMSEVWPDTEIALLRLSVRQFGSDWTSIWRKNGDQFKHKSVGALIKKWREIALL